LTIRLPSKKEEDGEGGTEGEGEGEGATLVEGDFVETGGEIETEALDETKETQKEKEAPMGGGKPFRKIHGKVYIIDGDEFVTDDDPKGDEKIDASGNLLGGM
jgi:chromatin structure-remodeling complex protein RSC7